MALYQPSMIVPDVRNGIGFGVADTSRNWSISWHVNGSSAMVAYQIDFYTNDSASTLVYSTGKLTDGCPFYGTLPDGTMQSFAHQMPAITLLTAGNSYKFVITQWWTENDSVVQNSASVFLARSKPSLSIDEIGTSGLINTQTYTFTGNYSQAQGDVLNWFRWRIADADNLNDLLYDSGSISGTMNIQTTFDGFFTGKQYAVRLNVQTQSGAEVDTGWVLFGVDYGEPTLSDELTVECGNGTNAVIVKWSLDSGGTLETPDQIGTLTYNGAIQTPTFDNYDPSQLTMTGQSSAVNAGTYTVAFTPNDGYNWIIADAKGWSIYRSDSDGRFTHVATVPAGNGQLYDYGAASRQGPYTYYAFPLDENGNVMDAPLQSAPISPCFQSWSLMECEENGDGYTVVEEYLFRYNFTSEAVSNNNTPTISENFTRYPTVQKSPQNYRGGSLSGLIGTVDGMAKYSDTLKLRQKLFGLSTTTRTLFLKSRKGDLIKVAVSEPIEAKMADETFEQQQSVTIRWVEIGEINKVLKLTALDSASGDVDNGSPELTLDPNYVVGNVGDTFTVTAYWRGNGVLSAAPGSGTSVNIASQTLTVSKGVSGTEVIPVSVSQTAQYDAQTVPLTVQALAVEYLAVPTQSGTLTYNGSAQSPTWSGYDPNKMTMSGTMSGTNAGDYSVTFTPVAGYEWIGGGIDARSVTWVIAKASPQLTVSPVEMSVAYGASATATATWLGDGTLSATSGAGATVSVSGATITVTGGSSDAEVVITVSTSETSNYLNGSSTISVTVSEISLVTIPTQSGTLTYSGSAQSPTWNNYDATKMVLSGTTTATNAGNYVATFTLNSGYTWEDETTGIKNVSWSIAKASPNLSVSPAEIEMEVGEIATVTATWSGNGVLSASSESGSIATATVSGNTIMVSGGSNGITAVWASISETQNYSGDTRGVYVEVTGSSSGETVQCTITNTTSDALLIKSENDFGSYGTIVLGESEETIELPLYGMIVVGYQSGAGLFNGTGRATPFMNNLVAGKLTGDWYRYTPLTYVVTRGGTFTWR